ncbi:MAG TPA: hypothetical protein VNO19_02610 [Gemmatimonadales bacterium]|nr:hypothetical protein [Gemmatimonadales bacterium]
MGCNVSGARSLANQLFPNSIKQIAQDSLGVIQNSGAGTAASTNAGFGILALVSTYGPNSPQIGSDLANAILPCMNVGSSPTDFTAALGPAGAFAVRGSSLTDADAAVSHDGAWGMQPPLNSTWNAITVPANTRLLAYGAPITAPGFTLEQPVGTIFDWFTIPTLTFSPGVVVGTCIVDNGPQYLIQHNALGEIVPSATTSFCPVGLVTLRGAQGWGPTAIAQRVFDFFSPRPLLATALGTRPPGGSIGSLSPNVAVNPGQITLDFPKQVSDGKTNQQIKFKDGTPVSVTVEPAGGTNLDGAVVELTAVANLGSPVIPTGNTAITNDGVATFPNLSLNKAGGYRFVATITGFGQNNAAGFNIVQDISNGFNLKQSK